MNVFEIVGATGLLFMATGVLLRHRCRQDLFYIIGGVCLEIYSIHLGHMIFIVLQAVFLAAALYDVVTRAAKKKC